MIHDFNPVGVGGIVSDGVLGVFILLAILTELYVALSFLVGSAPTCL